MGFQTAAMVCRIAGAVGLLLATCTPGLAASVAPGTAGIAMHGEPALRDGFSHLPYVDPDAPKGGRLTIGVQGTFDNLNPFSIKGVTVENVRGYVFESLMARSANEPFSLYGLIAERIEVAPDRSQATFHLRPQARFSDGRPVTAVDVAFSLTVLSERGPPYMRSHYKKVSSVETPDPHTVTFRFAAEGDREIPLILALMPILPKHATDAEAVGNTTLLPLIGSGPYTIAAVDPGRSVTFQRNADYWARDLPIRRGLFNFDEVRLEYFRDAAAMFEAFKGGTINFRQETDPVLWAEAYRFPAIDSGAVVKRAFDTGLPDGMRALVFNTRKPVFKDIRVRKALIRLFDFQSINRTLYSGMYARSESFFARSDLAAVGRPASQGELALLGSNAEAIDPDVLDGTWRLPTTDGSGNDRTALREAVDLLASAGYRIDGGQMRETATGTPLTFEYLARSKAEERLMLAFAQTLRRVGITASIRSVDDAQYWSRLKTFDYDMIQFRWSASLSPGNEQIHRWNSSYANVEGSQNFAGVENPVVDSLIKAMLSADTREALVDAVRAFDRVLISGRYVIPLFYAPKLWVAHRANLGHPATMPLFGFQIDAWWAKDR